MIYSNDRPVHGLNKELCAELLCEQPSTALYITRRETRAVLQYNIELCVKKGKRVRVLNLSANSMEIDTVQAYCLVCLFK